jgi:hypothetical protein
MLQSKEEQKTYFLGGKSMRIVGSYVAILLSLVATDQLETYVSFEHWPDQPYTTNMVLTDFENLVATDVTPVVEREENLSIKDSVLTFHMPKDKVWIEGSGSQIVMPILPQQEMTLEYSVYFDGKGSPYEWTSGGKLPGVAGGKGYTGGSPAGAGDGFSARLMFGEGGQLFAYVYHADMKGKYGDSLGIVAYHVLKQNEWNQIRIKYRINTSSDYNGRMEVWANGEYIGEKNYLRFCTNGCQIDKFLLVSFHGGQTPDYRPTKDQDIKFKWFHFSL